MGPKLSLEIIESFSRNHHHETPWKGVKSCSQWDAFFGAGAEKIPEESHEESHEEVAKGQEKRSELHRFSNVFFVGSWG